MYRGVSRAKIASAIARVIGGTFMFGTTMPHPCVG